MDQELNVQVEIDGKTIETADLLGIDENNLSTEYAAQAARFAYVAVLKARAKRLWMAAEATRKEVEASAFVFYKSDDGSIPTGGKSVSDGLAHELVAADDECVRVKEEEIKAEEDYRLLEALTSALDMRANMLVSLGADLRAERDMTSMRTNEYSDADLRKAVRKTRGQ